MCFMTAVEWKDWRYWWACDSIFLGVGGTFLNTPEELFWNVFCVKFTSLPYSQTWRWVRCWERSLASWSFKKKKLTVINIICDHTLPLLSYNLSYSSLTDDFCTMIQATRLESCGLWALSCNCESCIDEVNHS